MCNFVFKKRGLAAGRGRRKRPSSDQEQGEGLAGAREGPREGVRSRAVTILWGGGGPGATPEHRSYTERPRCSPQPYRCPCGGEGEGLLPACATARGCSTGLPHHPVGVPSLQEAASRACIWAGALSPGALLPLGFTSESSGEEGSTVVRKERRRETPNPMIQKVREPQ